MKRTSLVEVICCILILLFLYAAVSKFIDFKGFTAEMNNQPFPNQLTPFLVWAIPCLEILISVTLMLKGLRRTGLYASFILMTLFTIYTGLVLLHFFDRVPCSCGGVIKALSWQQHLVFNLFFVATSATGIYLTRSKDVSVTFQAVIAR